ncbi:glycosyltransferase [Vibrio cholerae]|uniref:glycosyltransferase n=1 Tax=Vibrio cholerae TaxID=666 RepID=UPI001582633F|nr:glycosyltransferase [Vibrio cholerae]EGR2119207.1 glycosyltransferase [Vibrio cholerae]EKF9219441.1 glycosyltransferase [Vibrio cholerae]QKU83240.1 glycosyltransferase [Vibrio cholerae]HDI3177841.1 glycosyltransferase [Vibrio cholerae]
MLKFSLLMSVYARDNPKHLRLAMESIVNSSVVPDQIVIVFDGPVGKDIFEIIRSFSNQVNLKIVRLKKNSGLGIALSVGMQHCSHEWIARFDSDDICISTRFEKQIAFISDNPSLDIVGTWVSEFESDPVHAHAERRTPIYHRDLVSFAKQRNPFNHMTVMYKKSSVLAAGGYKSDYLYEDYALWVRMIQNECITANIPEVLVHARTGNGMEVRRGGLKYVKSEVKAQYKFYKSGFISVFELIQNLAIRVPIRLAPGSVRRLIYRKTLRR